MSKPTLRVIHNLARSGRTLICKCLGTMQGTALLSELHPAALQLFNPLQQAHEWFGLLTNDDIALVQNQKRPMTFAEAISLIARRAASKGLNLVVRDWAHLDFTGAPWVDAPCMRLTVNEALEERFDIVRTATVRHPIDQWLSLRRLGVMRDPIDNKGFGIEQFMVGYGAFTEQIVPLGFIRYEDLTRNPQGEMKAMCERLQLPYDPTFIERWHQYTTITGDVAGTRGGNHIKPLSRRTYEPDMLARFEACPSYAKSLDLLGYDR